MAVRTRAVRPRTVRTRTILTRMGRTVRTAMAAMTLFAFSIALVSPSNAQVVHADADYDASGFVTPAGMAPPELNGGIMQAGYYPSDASSCDSGGCDSGCCDSAGCDSGGCDSMYGSGNMYGSPGGMYGGQGGVFNGSGGMQGGMFRGSPGGLLSGGSAGGRTTGGVFGKLQDSSLACGGCGMGGCRLCNGLSNLRHMCIFCRGQGCSACQLKKDGGILGVLGGGFAGLANELRPYTEAGLCAQRWYDLSAEGMFLGHTTGGGSVGGLTSQGEGGPIVLGVGDADGGGELESGVRISGALMFGAGANIEGTWIGGHDWSSSASVSDPNAELFSFITDFGQDVVPLDDVDRSLSQSVSHSSEFDSVELNYRRRTVWPYCRFQGSWLVGLRYVRYDDGLIYRTRGETDNGNGTFLLRFLDSEENVENKMFGAQAGGDMWWNINPGVSLGIGGKLLWMKNDVDRRTRISANSLGPLATIGTANLTGGDQGGVFGGEFETKLVWRLSHSWTARTSYYLLAIDDVAFGSVNGDTIRTVANAAVAPTRDSTFRFDSLVVQGFSIGAEFAW